MVVNVAGPHSYVINRMAGVYESMNIKTRALRHEVHHAPGPAGFDYEHDGFNIADDDNGIYFRPETGNHILVGSTDPRCDPQDWVDPRRLRPADRSRAVGGPGAAAEPAPAVGGRAP